MGIDTHIKCDGVVGESLHADHKGEIDLLSWSWNVQNDSALAGGGSGKGNATPGLLTFTHVYDKASPVLAKKSAQGVHFKDAVITARKSGEGQKDFLKVTLKEVFITSVAPNGSSGGDIIETVTCSYAQIDFSYKPQDDKGGLGAADGRTGGDAPGPAQQLDVVGVAGAHRLALDLAGPLGLHMQEHVGHAAGAVGGLGGHRRSWWVVRVGGQFGRPRGRPCRRAWAPVHRARRTVLLR